MRKLIMFLIMAGLAAALFNKFASAEDQRALTESPIYQAVTGFFDSVKSAIEPSDTVSAKSPQPEKSEQVVKRPAPKRSGGKPGLICIESEGGMSCN